MQKVCVTCNSDLVKLESISFNQFKIKYQCIKCLHKEFARTRWTFILCLQKLIPGIKDLHRLIAGPRYTIFPWQTVAHWNFWMYSGEIEEMYDPTEPIDTAASETSLVIKFIDRGVNNFHLFAKYLNQMFPKLERLQWSQNYSIATFSEFKCFVASLKLKKLWLSDKQSDIFEQDHKWDELFEVMPENSIYTFRMENEFDIEKVYLTETKQIWFLRRQK